MVFQSHGPSRKAIIDLAMQLSILQGQNQSRKSITDLARLWLISQSHNQSRIFGIGDNYWSKSILYEWPLTSVRSVSKSGPRSAEGHKKKEVCMLLLLSAAATIRRLVWPPLSSAAVRQPNFIARQPLAQFSWADCAPAGRHQRQQHPD